MYTSDRTFKIWHYSVSHSVLLLRSPRSATERLNSDLVFVGVEYIDLPPTLKGLSLQEKSDNNLSPIPRETAQRFVIKCSEREYTVVASAVKIYENELDIFDSGLEWS